MRIFICQCGYTWVVDSSPIPEFVLGPIYAPDTVTTHYWMHKPKLTTLHDWYEQYADCAMNYFRELFK